jgi:hypothetical protein
VATAFSAIKTRLQNRLGFGSVSTTLSNQLNEAWKAGLARAFSDGIPGLQRDTFTGTTFGEVTNYLVNDAGIQAADTTITLDTGTSLVTDKVALQDILEVDSKKYLIRDVTSETVLDLGAPIGPDMFSNNDTTKIIRRSIQLPSAGSVVGVKLKDGRQLAYEPRNALFDPYETGDPLFFEQRYSTSQDKSYLILYPAPTSATVVTIIQNRDVTSDLTDEIFEGPEEALDAILERAVLAFKTWQGQTDSVEATLATSAVRDTANQLQDASSPLKIFVRE